MSFWICVLIYLIVVVESKHHSKHSKRHQRDFRMGRSLIAIGDEGKEEKSWFEKHIEEIQDRSKEKYGLWKWQPFIQKMIAKK